MKYQPLLSLLLLFAACNQENNKYGFVSIRGTKMYYEEHGHGLPLLILSGGGINRSVRDFDMIVPLLASEFRLILPDSPGQGKSDQPDTLSYDILTDYFSQFIDTLQLDSVYVMGWSDGAIAALLLGERKPLKVKRIIAVGANNGLEGALPPEIDVSQVQPQALEVWGENNKDAVDAYTNGLKKDWKKMMTQLNGMWYQRKYFPDSLLTRIKAPTMIVQGDKDEMVVDHALFLHRQIPNSQLCILPSTTHEVFAERAELISEIAIKFFR